MNLAKNTILLTGGATGLGFAMAKDLVAAGSKVIICGRRPDRLAEAVEKIPGLITRVCDVADDEQREDLYRWVTTHYPETNVLINNAGIQLITDMSAPVDISRVRQELEINVTAPIHLSSLFSEFLATKKEAAIVNITSGLAFVPMATLAVYCASKAALHSLSISLRHQLRKTSVKVFEIAPPAAESELGKEDNRDHMIGMTAIEFSRHALEALQNDTLEALVGQAAFMRVNPDVVFGNLNPEDPSGLLRVQKPV